MWMAFLIGWRTNMCYITGEVRRVDTHTTANPKEPRQISVTVHGPMVTLTSRKCIVHIPVPEEPGIQSFITNGDNRRRRLETILWMCRMGRSVGGKLKGSCLTVEVQISASASSGFSLG
jgi:hypothetical protein